LIRLKIHRSRKEERVFNEMSEQIHEWAERRLPSLYHIIGVVSPNGQEEFTLAQFVASLPTAEF
jgi:hypothetical protein